MKPNDDLVHQILDIVTLQPGCRIEQVADLVPDLTLKEVFLTLGYLSRRGLLELIVDREGGFAVAPTARVFN